MKNKMEREILSEIGYMTVPTLTHEFRLQDWGNLSRPAIGTLSNALTSIHFKYKNGGKGRLMKYVEFIFNDDLEGTVTTAIEAITQKVSHIVVDIMRGDGFVASSFNLYSGDVEEIIYSLDYSKSDIAQYKVIVLVGDVTRTID